MSILLDFMHPQAVDPSLTGGKGANLARLTQAGFPVPEGFVLTAAAYEAFAGQARPLLARAAREFAFDDPARLEQQCAALGEELGRLPLPAEAHDTLKRVLADFPEQVAFSVRSSATTEDLGGAAFAGQHETFLNCRGAEDIANRVRDCWLSLWSGRAVGYRRSAGFDVLGTSMAVVVQRMVFCDVAGVGFSLNPVSGNLKEQVVDANFGLGESVVGGEAPIDHFVIEKAGGTVIAQEIAEKEFKIVAGETGTAEVPLEAAQRKRSCLDAGQIRELSALMRKVEQLYGYPQDVEWGFAGGRLWLLQSRPVTRIPARWTRDESAERFPSVITPLAWDLVEEGFHTSLNYSFALMGLPPFRDKWFAMFDHYIYGNQNAVEVYANGAGTAIRLTTLDELVAAIPMLRKQYGWVLELPFTWSRDLDHYLIRLGELQSEPLEGKSEMELWGYILRVKELGAEYFQPNIAISITQRTLYRILLGILQIAVGKEQAPRVFDLLLAHCDTKTGVINKELYQLARRIAAQPALVERLRRMDSAAFLEQGGFSAVPDIARAFEKFLRDHGHREVEFDPYHATWLEAPWLVIDNIKAMLDARLESPQEKERELRIAMRETEFNLMQRLPAEIRYFIHEIIRLTRSYTTLDDVEHYQTTRLTLPFRRGLRALGKALMGRGVVDDPMDVFFARAAEIDAALRADGADAWERLARRIRADKADYRRHKQASPPWEIGLAAPDAPGDPTQDLHGLPGSPGVASGPVYVVHGSEDFAGFPKGAVLVARTTNPAWTPLFYKAAAVITESGGPLSHGAVTAREIGVPAVMSVRGVLSALENGQHVTVDGGAGRVSRK
jgi:rifampicin phosphotransferase